MNTVIISGNLTRDPDLAYAQAGMAIAKFTIANNRKWTEKDGTKKESVAFISVTAFGKQAEVISQYFKKGNPIFVQGRLSQDTWEDKTTREKKSKTYVVLESFEFMGGKRDESAPRQSAPVSAIAPAPVAGVEEDDVPF